MLFIKLRTNLVWFVYIVNSPLNQVMEMGMHVTQYNFCSSFNTISDTRLIHVIHSIIAKKTTLIHIIYPLNRKTVLKDLGNAFYHDMRTKITTANRPCFFPKNV